MASTETPVARTEAEQHKTLPPLSRDPAFLGMTGTQFLGAFNDNVFRQLITLFILTSIVDEQAAATYQSAAYLLFAMPFILFSGFAGYLSDKFGKRLIVILSKVAELVIMLLGTVAFLTGQIWPLMVVLFLMGMQTTFFSPAKYGILPEMLRTKDLPQANGIISMTTFLAIILGMIIGGLASQAARDVFGGQYWVANFVCIVVAIAGIATAMYLRNPPPASSNLHFHMRDLFMTRETAAILKSDRPLFDALFVNSVFWFLAGVVQPTLDHFGIKQLDAGDTYTSILKAVLAVGIAAGFLCAGRLSRGMIRFRMIPYGAGGITISLLMCAIVAELPLPFGAIYGLECFGLFLTGFSTGLFALPLATFLQVRPPHEQKGRIIAAMNFFNWVGIAGAAVFYFLCAQALAMLNLGVGWTLAIVAILMGLIPIFYHPVNMLLEDDE
ncbi:MFS transporter [Calycomorphotria hydatis]|uniref:Lysophospholipid transporter LplT n=1 Tax=Calycomorphotria hydatis TaxID=2528027 RepID=A0A517T3R2_9PLAN|nr:MFS transporter [Calycomorphotria hydatis]QDT63017.1 Lysophospholipid transporter LplT [Calycomorphotria hydatis]